MLHRVSALSLAPLALIGCSPAHMREVRPATRLAATPDAATVLFIRPHAFPGAAHYTLLDTKRGPSGCEVRFLGESAPNSHFAVAIAPGEHVFLGVGNGRTDAVRANLAPGRVYFVEVASGVLQGIHLVALTPASPHWHDVDAWVHETTQLAPDRLAGQADLMRNAEPLDEAIASALARLEGYDARDLETRTLRPEDGTR
jgi:hypothetical protein